MCNLFCDQNNALRFDGDLASDTSIAISRTPRDIQFWTPVFSNVGHPIYAAEAILEQRNVPVDFPVLRLRTAIGGKRNYFDQISGLILSSAPP